MFAGEWSVLQKPNSRVVGPNGVLEGGTGGAAIVSPTALAGTEAWYDIQDPSSMVIDGSNRVSLVADKSGNSAENCLILPGVAGNYGSTPDSAALDVTDDIDIIADISMSKWVPSSTQAVVNKRSSVNDISYTIRITPGGELELLRSPDGTAAAAVLVTSTEPTGVSDFGRKWIRCYRNSTTGDTKFYLSDDGESWTQLGSTVSDTPASLYSTSAILEIGASQTGTALRFIGNIYRAQVWNGDSTNGGTLVFDADFTAQSKLATSFTESSSNAATVTINQTAIALPARIHGARDRYQGVAANQPIYLSAVNQSDDLNTNTAVNGSSPFATFTGESATGVTFADSSANARRLSWQLSKPLVIGRKYRVTFDYTRNSGSAQTSLQLRANADGAVGQVIASDLGSTGQRNITFTATVTDRYLTVNKAANGDNSVDAEISNLSFVELESPSAYLYYDGSNDYMKTAPFPLEQPESVYFSGSQVSWTSGDYLFDGNAANSGAVIQTTSTPQLNLNAGSSVAANTGLAVGTNGVLTSVFNGASSSLRVNLGTATTGNAGAADLSGFSIGASGTPGNYGNITETGIIIRSTADDAVTQARFIRYLAQKGGISV